MDSGSENDAEIRAINKRRKKKKNSPKVPLRPFQAPPRHIDVTDDVLFEKKWKPLVSYVTRKNTKLQ